MLTKADLIKLLGNYEDYASNRFLTKYDIVANIFGATTYFCHRIDNILNDSVEKNGGKNKTIIYVVNKEREQ